MKLYFLCYLGAVSALAVILTAYDKAASKKRRARRIRERTLLLLAAFGGAAAMYLTMLVIRHKTRHRKFMLGLPFLIVLHIGLYIGCYFLH